MNPLDQSMREEGWVRCPNCWSRWYAGHSGKLEPAFPMELRVTDAIWLVTRPYGPEPKEIIPLMRFESVADLENYLTNNGKPSEAAAAFSNGWD